MEDHGKIITHFETLFGDSVDHEVIKIILQACDWDSTIAYEQILNLSDCIPVEDVNTVPESIPVEDVNTVPESIPVEDVNTVPESIPVEDVNTVPERVTCSVLETTLPTATINNNSISSPKSNAKIDVTLNKIDFIKKLIADKKKILIIMRGLPGSGKSTLAQSLNTNGIVLSTDDYFYDKFRNYNYNPNILSEAHNWNKDRAKFRIFKGVSPIFIDNTNLQLWEFEPYIRFALQNGYYVDILEPQTYWKYDCKMLSKKCTHNVHSKKIIEMRERFENISIEDILKKLNLSNNTCDFDVDYCRSVSRNSDPDIVIEDSSDSSEAESFMNNNNNMSHLDIQNDQKAPEIDFEDHVKTGNVLNFTNNVFKYVEKVPEDIFADQVKIENDEKLREDFFNFTENFKKFLTTKDGQHRDLSEVTKEFAKENNDVDRAEDEAMYKLCSDIEDKMGKPFFSCLSIGEEKVVACLKEFPEVLHLENKDTPSQLSIETLKDWSCISASAIDELQSWEVKAVEKEKNNSISDTCKPQRLKKIEIPLFPRDSHTSNSSSSEETADDDDEAISWEPVNDKSKLSWENNSSISPMGGHGAIPKRVRSPKFTARISAQPHVKLKMNNFTQYLTSDYSSSCHKHKIIKSDPSAYIPGPLIDIKENEPLTKTKLLLHKSTMTDDIFEHEKSAQNPHLLQELKSFFPDIPADDLEDVLEKCDYDIDWTMNILIDSGYKISSNASCEHQLSDDDNPNSTDVRNPDLHHDFCISSVTTAKEEECDLKHGTLYPLLNFEDNDISSNECIKDDGDDKYSLSGNTSDSLLTDNDNEEDSTKEGAQYLTMEIDKQFASQLINLFGPISSINLCSGFTKEDCKIVIPLELCHDIYKYWSNTLEGKFQHDSVLDMYTREDGELARKLQEEENAIGKLPDEENTPQSFQEIVEMQKSLENNSAKSKSKERTCATMLSLQKLQEEYEHVDPSTVEDEYCNQNFDYTATRSILSYKYGNSKLTPKTVLAPGTVLLPTKEDSPEEEENWEDFAIAADNPQMYRNEAQVHYLERQKLLRQAEEAQRNGLRSAASYYAQEGSKHMQHFLEANERASKKIRDAINSDKSPNTLDLHLLHVDEALREAQSFLSERRNVLNRVSLKCMKITIITGRGNHSFKGEARLKPAIKAFLQKEGYEFIEYSGMFEVYLRHRKRK